MTTIQEHPSPVHVTIAMTPQPAPAPNAGFNQDHTDEPQQQAGDGAVSSTCTGDPPCSIPASVPAATPTSAGVPSSVAAGVIEASLSNLQTFARSPLLLRLEGCYCQRFHVQLDHGCQPCEPNAKNAVKLMLSRLAHLFRWLRGTPPPALVEDATTRVCLELRQMDYELFHLAAFEKPVSSAPGAPRQIHILFLVPSTEGSAGHRAVAEILARVDVHQATEQALRVDNVSERYEADWGCWRTYRKSGFKFFRGEYGPGSEPPRVRLGENGLHTAAQVRGEMWADVARDLQGEQRKAERDFGYTVAMAVKAMAARGRVFSAYEVEVGYQKMEDGSGDFPAAMVSLFTVPRATLPKDHGPAPASDQWKLGESERVGSGAHGMVGPVPDRGPVGSKAPPLPGPKPKSLRSRERVSAVIILDIMNLGDRHEVDGIAVIYNGEWPLARVYRQDTPAPDLAGLGCYVKEQAPDTHE